MNTGHAIAFTGIADITPVTSTFADVTRQLGIDFKVERVPSRQTERWTFPDKSILRYPAFNLAVVFIDPGFRLLPATKVSVVGAEVGCAFQTVDGLCVGMPLADAIAIIDQNYAVINQFAGCIEIVSADGKSPTFLGVHHDNDAVEFIGLYRRDL
jgi:hypothetical protein